MFRRLFGFGKSDPLPDVDKTQSGDLENWTLNQELNRYEFTKNGYNYKRIPDILDPENRVTNDFYIKNAVEFTEIATYDLKSATVMIDGNLTVRAEVTILNGIIDLMYGTGTSGREHELKIDHDFTFTNGEFKHVYAVRHFLNGTDDNMLGTLADIHGLNTINDIQASVIIGQNGNPSLLKESLKVGNRSTDTTMLIKNITYHYELVLVQDSMDLDNCHIYGDTIELNSEDAAPKILSSANNASITCKTLKFSTKMTIKNVELHVDKITFANTSLMNEVGIEDCTLYNKLQLNADSIKLFRGNTVFVEGFCIQVEDNKNLEINMKMYNKGDLNGKNKMINNFVMNEGSSFEVVRKTLHNDFSRIYQTTGEYITEQLNEGEKYTADTYVNYDVYIQWLTECITKFGSFNIAEYKIGNTVYKESKNMNEFIEILKNKRNVQKVEIIRAATTISAYVFEFQHQTDSNEYKKILITRFPNEFNDYWKDNINNSLWLPVNRNDYQYGTKCENIQELRKAIVFDFYMFLSSNNYNVTKDEAIRFIHECEVIAKCEILAIWDYQTYIWKSFEEVLDALNLPNNILSNNYFYVRPSDIYFTKFYRSAIEDTTKRIKIDFLPLRYDFIQYDDWIPIMAAQFYVLDNTCKTAFIERIKSITDIQDKRMMFKTKISNNIKVDFLTTIGNYINDSIAYENRPILGQNNHINIVTPYYETTNGEGNRIECDIMYNYAFNAVNGDPTVTKVNIFDTYESILRGTDFDDTKTMLKNLLNFTHNTNDTVRLIRDAFNRYITLGTNREQFYKCVLIDNGTEIEKSLLELDNVGSANSVTQVMTEHTSTTFTVPLHTNPQTYYTKYNGQDNIHFNIKTADDIMNDMNDYLYDNRQNVYWGNTSNPIVFPNDNAFNSDNLLQYLIEDQFYSGKKIILHLKGNNRDEWCELDNLESRDDFLLAFWNSGVEINTGSSYHVLKMNKPMLSEGPLIPLHNAELPVIVENAPDSPTVNEQVNTLDALINVEVEGNPTSYTVKNPWFKHYREMTKQDLAQDIQDFRDNESDMKKVKEYVLEIQYFLGFPLYFSNATGIYDLAHYSFEDTTINVIDPVNVIQNNIYARSNGDWIIVYNGPEFLEKIGALFELPLATEEHIDMKVGKELFNYVLLEILKNSWIDDPMPSEGNTYEAKYPSTFGLDITMKEKNQDPTEAKTYVVNDIRKDIDTLFDKLKEYREEKYGTNGEMICTVIFKNVRLYGTLEGKLPLHEKEFEFNVDGNIFLAIVRSFDKKVIVKDIGLGNHEVDNPWFDRYDRIDSISNINGDISNYIEQHNPTLEELKQYLLEIEYYAGRQIFYNVTNDSTYDLAYLNSNNVSMVFDPYSLFPAGCYVLSENTNGEKEWFLTLKKYPIRYLPSIPLIKNKIEERAKNTFNSGFMKLLENSKLKAENEEFPVYENSNELHYYNGTIDSDIICNFQIDDGTSENKPTLYDEDVHLRDVLDHLYDDIKNNDKVPNGYYPNVDVKMIVKDVIPYTKSNNETLHENMNIYEANGETSVKEVAEIDIKKYTTYTTEDEKKQYLNECLEKLPGNLEAFIKYKIGEVAEEPVYKYIRLQELLNGNKTFDNVPENLETFILVTDRFYQNILERDSLEYKELENEAKNEMINSVITRELKELLEYDIPIFLERAKQMIIFYCTKDNKMIKDILIHLMRSESIMIIRKGIKTIKLTEEPLETTLLNFVNTLESDNSIYPNITNTATGELVEASSIYVMPKYIKEEQSSQEDTLISTFNSLQLSFETQEYQYGMEYPKYRYTQREIFTEVDEILNDKHIGILASRRRATPEEEQEEWKYNAYPYEDFIQMNTNIERNLHIFSMEVINDVTGTTMMKIKRTSSLDGVISTVDVTEFIDSWIVSRLLKRTNYPVENYDLEYTNDNDQKEIIRISDLVIKDGFEEVTQNEAYIEKRSFKMKAPFKLTKVENEYELPLIPEEVSTAGDMYNTLKDKAEDMTPEQFETYSKEYLDDLYSRARKSGIYIYFVHTIVENENTVHEVIPMSQTVELTKGNINEYELFSVNPTVPEETITTIQDFKAKCVLNYEYMDNEEHRIGYSFYIGELMTLYAKKLQSQLIDNYKIQASIFQGSKLENNETILDYVDFGDFLIQQIKTNKVYKQIEFKDKANEVDFFSVWSPVNTTERSAVKELADMINLYLTNEIDMITLKLYFYEWQMKAAYLSYNEEDHSVVPSSEPSKIPVTFQLATSEIRSYTLKDLRGCCQGLTITCLLSLEDEQLREVLSTNTFINPYPYRIEQVSDIIDDGDDSEEENEEDIYILKDEDQNETRGWIYTGLIRRLIMKYLEGSLRGNETSWNNITSRTMMSNDEMSNIITLLNTRYNSENTKAQNIPELHNILEPAEGFGIIDALNLILDKEQTYNRENVKYSEEEISDILDSIERWYNYYEPDTKTFLNTADIMIWEGMELECHTDITSFESRADLIVEDYKKIHNKFNNTPTKDLVAIGANGTTVKFNVRRYRPIQDSEWLQLINEMQGIRNAWQSVPGTEDNRVLLCIGSNYGEIWSVFGRQPGTDLPLETYLYLKNQTTSTGSSRTNTLEITNNVIYIPKDRENSDLIWDVDKYFHTNMYQLLLYPYYAMINDTSKFKDFINPILANNPQEVVIEYLGYIVMVPKTSGQSAHKH